MSLLILKFGGSSVADLVRMNHVAQIIKDIYEKGYQVVVTVSAMYGETDRLIKLARAASKEMSNRECDALLATGEQASAALLSMVLMSINCPARSYNAIQAGILSDHQHGKASILNIDTTSMQRDIDAGIIPVVAGFQGVNERGDFTTLGRGGSDLTAVMLAAALKAHECQIFTDVDGVYTSDPQVVSDARRLSQISFSQMWQLAELGAKVLQKAAVKLADKHHVKIRVLSSFVEGPGTLVIPEFFPDFKGPLLSGVALDPHQAKLMVRGLPHRSSIVSDLIDSIGHAAIDIDMMVQNNNATQSSLDVSFTVHRDDYERAFLISEECSKHLTQSQVLGDPAIGKLSLVGMGLKSHAGIASKVFQILVQEGIDVQLITSSETKISTVISEKYLKMGAQLLHSAFNLNESV